MKLLNEYTVVPPEMLECGAEKLHALLGGPSLFYLEGRRSPPLFITVLQHGNEPTGFDALQRVLKRYQTRELPRSVWIFIANVKAAAVGRRVLEDQTDYNRAWPGTVAPHTVEAALMQQVIRKVTERPLFASIDLHNNTGCNPHYGCVNELDTPFLHLASLFARTVVYFRLPVGVQSLAMSEHCPAVTLECGQAGENAALEHACEFIDACLHLHHIPEHPVAARDVNLLKTLATVKMNPGVSFGYEPGKHDVCFRRDLDHFNFGLLEKASVLAELKPGAFSGEALPTAVTNEAGDAIAADFFEILDNRLVAKRDIIPSMATLDVNVIRQDCLFYVMEKMDFPMR